MVVLECCDCLPMGFIREIDIIGTNPEVLTNSWQSKTVSLTLATELAGAIFGL